MVLRSDQSNFVSVFQRELNRHNMMRFGRAEQGVRLRHIKCYLFKCYKITIEATQSKKMTDMMKRGSLVRMARDYKRVGQNVFETDKIFYD